MTTAKRVVTKFNFDKLMQSGAKAHVALVDSAANEQEVLVMKAKAPSVQVTMELDEFIKKFFGLWEDDADALIKILGYEEPSNDSMFPDDDRDEKYQEYDESKGHTTWVSGVGYTDTDGYIKHRIGEVSLLKGKDVPETLSENMVDLIKNLQETVGNLETPSVEGEVIQTEKSSNEGEQSMNEEEILAMQAELADLKKAKEDSAALIAELADLKKAKEDQRKANMTDLVKGLNFVATDAQEDVIEALLKSEQSDVLVVALEKAREAIEAAVTQEDGHDQEGETITDTQKASNDAVIAALAARKAK